MSLIPNEADAEYQKEAEEAAARAREGEEWLARRRSWRGEVNRYTVDECS